MPAGYAFCGGGEGIGGEGIGGEGIGREGSRDGAVVEHSPPTNVARVRFPDSRRVG